MLSKFLPLCLLAATVSAVDKPKDADLNAKLKTSANELAKLDLIKDDLVYDFKSHPYFTYASGGVVNANAATFPAATGHGLTIAWLALGPCAMLPPHLHPRATNFVVAVEGETQTWMVQENGAEVVTTTLTPGKMTIFPHGSVHSMQNTGCGNSTLISALNSDDTGTTNLLNALFNLPDFMVAAAFGTDNATSFGASVPAVGTGAALGSAECRAKCGLD
ncbi:RmlC-like cupin domain-containing protein [Coniochaeta sp. 2T2.1]|nr:RmlC-like cupin domain-containing protein [Coniochaeta sp. 2T2.1]